MQLPIQLVICFSPSRVVDLQKRVDELQSTQNDHLEKLDDRASEISDLKREVDRLMAFEEQVSAVQLAQDTG